MKKLALIFALILFSTVVVSAQAVQKAHIGFGIGNNDYLPSIGWTSTWNVGKKKKFEIGVGLRYNLFWGNNKNFTSAPADLASEDSKIDTLFISNPQTNSLNVLLYTAFHITPKFDIGFNIDLLGLGFGGERTGTLIVEGAGQEVLATPTEFNLLLVGNNDKGQLSSEFWFGYNINEKLLIRGGYNYFFAEYKTLSNKQNGNDRYRHKASMFFLSLTVNILQ